MTTDIQTVAEQAPAPQTNILAVISAAATNPAVDVDKMKALLDMQERVMDRQALIEFNAALADLQAEMPVIAKRGAIKNKEGKVQSTYAKFEDINEAIKPLLKKFGFAISYRTNHVENHILVTGILMHRAGHREETTIRLPYDESGSKNKTQSVGSSLKYGERYVMCALLNISTEDEDDDAQSAHPPKLISAPQRDAILRALGTPERTEKFLSHNGLADVGELGADQFDLAMAQIKGGAGAKPA